MSTLRLASGLEVDDPLGVMTAFCREEYDYYDAIPDTNPDRIAPVDVLATVSVNAFAPATASKIRLVHRGLAQACDPLLPTVPRTADLATADGPTLKQVEQLIDGAVQAPQVLVAVATKVLHRKRPALIPMLDSVVLTYYRDTRGIHTAPAVGDKRRAASAAAAVLREFRTDLLHTADQLRVFAQELTDLGFAMTPVRILEVLIWAGVEPLGYYRSTATQQPAPTQANMGRPDHRP